MNTTQMAAQLFHLQQVDLELDRLTAELQSVIHTLQGDASLKRLRAEYKVAQQQVQTALQAQKEAEWALEDVNNRLKVQEERLFSGGVNNPKELQPLQNEVQRLRGQQSHQEEVTLEVLDVAETLQEMAQRKYVALKQAEDAWEQEATSLVARRDQLEMKQQELQKKRKELSSGVEQEILQRYDTMRRTKQGRAVSKIEQNSCQWCRVILTPSELQQVRISRELQMCTNCGRILYHDR
jgi:predicted  nucleic acid-binding Zn-ribbon protein